MNSGTEKRDRLVKMIEDGLAGIRREIGKEKAGVEALDGLRQLLFMEAKLAEMQQVLHREDWRSHPKAKPGIARMVVDTWPIHDPLGNLLSQIEYEYER